MMFEFDHHVLFNDFNIFICRIKTYEQYIIYSFKVEKNIFYLFTL